MQSGGVEWTEGQDRASGGGGGPGVGLEVEMEVDAEMVAEVAGAGAEAASGDEVASIRGLSAAASLTATLTAQTGIGLAPGHSLGLDWG